MLVARHEGRLRAFLTRVAGSDIADDIAQETFLRAWRRAADYSGQGHYAGWLYRIAWRLALDHFRNDARRRERDAAAHDDETRIEPVADTMIDASRLLGLLDEKARAALILCDGHGWTHTEAAHMLSMPVGTLKSLILRSKQRLRTAMEEWETS